jgi:hypothetical protein
MDLEKVNFFLYSRYSTVLPLILTLRLSELRDKTSVQELKEVNLNKKRRKKLPSSPTLRNWFIFPKMNQDIGLNQDKIIT